MVDFNPDVQPAPEPISTDVTRPIQRPEANKSRGTLFASAGDALKETGQIIGDATKLKDFTDKEQIANTALIATEAERQGHIGRLEDLNVSTGTEPSMLAGGTGPSIPAGLKPLVRQAQALATGKADENQLDVYYKSRIDMLAKQYRQNYPQYRDYIDHVFSKMGFGNPANEYMASLQRQFLKNQAALNTKDTETWAMIKEGLDKAGYPFNQFAQQHRAGVDVYDAVSNELARVNSNRAYVTDTQKAYELNKTVGEARKDAMEKVVTDTGQSVLGSEMNSKATPGALGSIIDRTTGYMRNPETANEDQVQQDAAALTGHIDRIKDMLIKQGNDTHDYQDPITGKRVTYTNRQVMGGSAFDSNVAQTLSHLTSVRDSLVNHDYGAATFDARLVAGWDSSFKKHIYSQPTLGGVMMMMNEIKSYPEASREFLKGIFADPNLVNIPNELKGASESWAARFLTRNPGSAKEAVETLSKETNNPAANNFILNQTEQILNKKIDPALRNNAVEAFFGPKNAGITNGMSDKQASGYFAKVTEPAYVEAVNGLGKKAVETHQTWVEGEVSRLFAKDFKELPEMADKFKLHYDDQTHQFGLDYGKNKNINRWPNSALIRAGIDVYAKHYSPIIDRVNAAAGGLANIAISQGKEPNAYIIRNMQATGNTQNDFWRSVQGLAQQYKEPVGPKKPGVGAGP